MVSFPFTSLSSNLIMPILSTTFIFASCYLFCILQAPYTITFFVGVKQQHTRIATDKITLWHKEHIIYLK